jgi:hypothetical protein
VECVITAIFLSHQKFGVEIVKKDFVQNALNITVHGHMLGLIEHAWCLHILYYFFHDSYILTITMIFHDANSTTRTLMFFTVQLELVLVLSSSPSFCGMCDSRHIYKPSEVWCRECEEGLCTECIEYHSSVKLSRGHTTIYGIKDRKNSHRPKFSYPMRKS